MQGILILLFLGISNNLMIRFMGALRPKVILLCRITAYPRIIQVEMFLSLVMTSVLLMGLFMEHPFMVVFFPATV
ncbi:hypothetical protein H70737_02460 [Paenibacillus sp. FSL H7-0737]|nr:hypothetical protein H70737_02460 [Paenibacillus sp. FSL H7-0737]